MPRPLIQHGIGKLEEIFANGKADAMLLKQLEHELQHRQVPRAVALLSEVQAAMTGGSAAPASVRTVAPAARPLETTPVAKASAPPPAMPLEVANKILKATLGTPWESIEQTRRTLVHQAHPSRWKTMSLEKREQALAEAKGVNVAYALLLRTRCGGP